MDSHQSVENDPSKRCPRMPEEVLRHIFTFLETSDLRSVRRTCSAWYDACNSLQKPWTEKLYIEAKRVGQNPTLVFDTLISSQRKYFCLKFRKFDFRECSFPFWWICGSRIVSLTFQQCSFESGSIFHEILVNCVNLQYLDVDSIEDSFQVNKAICDGFNEFKIENKKLLTLKLRKICHLLNDFTYSHIVHFFPNVREILLESLTSLNFSYLVDRRYYSETEKIYGSEDIFSFSCVFNHLKSNASQLKALSLHKLERGLTPYWCERVGEIPNLKLTSLSLENHNSPGMSIANLLSKQTDLIRLRLHECSFVYHAQAMQLLVRNCPKLECLDVYDSHQTRYGVRVEYLFLSPLWEFKKLKEFHFRLRPSTKLVIPSADEPVTNRRYDHLRDFTHPKTTICFVQHVVITFYNLTSLALYPSTAEAVLLEINDRDLQIVFNNLRKLKTFKVVVGAQVSDYGFTGNLDHEYLTSSISNLINLETLDIRSNEKSRVTNRTFNEFVFPNLKTLNLIFHHFSDDEFAKSWSTNLPVLKHLSLTFGAISHTVFLSLLQLEQLATLRMSPVDEDYSIGDCRRIFSTNNSLQYCKISNHLLRRSCTFVRNIFTQEWCQKKRTNMYEIKDKVC